MMVDWAAPLHWRALVQRACRSTGRVHVVRRLDVDEGSLRFHDAGQKWLLANSAHMAVGLAVPQLTFSDDVVALSRSITLLVAVMPSSMRSPSVQSPISSRGP